METVRKRITSKAVRIVFALVLLFGLLPVTALTAPQHAYAATSTLSVGKKISYAGYSTHLFDVNGHWAFCVNPEKPTPPAGSYEDVSLFDNLVAGDGSGGHTANIEWASAWIYYSYGAPGYDESMWPDTWYDGSAWTEDKRIAISHILWTNAYENTGLPAYAGTNQAFKEWYDREFNDYFGNPDSANSFMRQARERWEAEHNAAYRQAFRDACRLLLVPGGYQNIGYISDFNPTGSIELTKKSANESVTEGNANYTLEGAQYGVYASYDDAVNRANAVATLTTNADGWAKAEGVAVGDAWVREVSAADGYTVDESIYQVSVPAGGTAYVNGGTVTDAPINDPASILVGKYDGEKTYNGEANLPQGSASLEGAEFTVRYYDGFYGTAEEAEASGEPTRTWVFATDADGFVYLNDSYKVSGNSLYYNEAGAPIVPRGTLLIQETKAPEGYVLNGEVFVQQVKKPGDATTVSTYNEPEVPDQVVRGDVELVKADELTQERMAGVPFRITSATTGESHIAVTDANGMLSTASGQASHVQNANANDTVADGDGDGWPDYSAEWGVWFGEGDPDDSKGALPYDTYTIEELPCAANEGLELVSLTVVITKPGHTVDLGTADDPGVVIGTYATDSADGDKHVAVDDSVTVNDRVDYSNLIPGREYRMEAQLVDASDGGKVIAEAETAFTPEKSYGYVNMVLEADTLALAGHDLVVYETLSCDGRILAEHADIADSNQTVTVVPPEIGTTANDGIDGDKTVVADPEATVVDTVSYTGLVPGREYVLSGTLVDKATGEPFMVNGSAITSETVFTPEKSSGTVDVTFEFDASAIAGGTELVAFETLTRAGVEIAVHADVDDEGQTVTVATPEIGTTAKDGIDGNCDVVADAHATVVDTVAYTNLIPGKEYTLNGSLMVKNVSDDGSVSEEPLLDADGNPVTASAVFTPEESHGTVDVTFEFDASLLAGKTLVAFETLMRGEHEIAVHADIDDEKQTVYVVPSEIGTTAGDALDGDKTVVADAEATVTDVVSYTNLIPGESYTFAGILMDKATGLPLLAGEGASDVSPDELRAFSEQLAAAFGLGTFQDDGHGNMVYTPNGREDGAFAPYSPDFEAVSKLLADNAGLAALLVTSAEDVVPEDGTGTVAVEFAFDASNFIQAEQAADTVVFEYLLKGGSVVAEHADLESGDQTFQIAPSGIGTEATDKTDGDHVLLPSQDAAVVDTVSYTNLIPGKEYVLSGMLVDKATGEPLYVGDKQVSSEVRFTPNSPDGTVQLEFRFDSTGLVGHELVAFESLSKDGVEVAVHADVDDEAQTVSVEEQPAGSVFGKTGDVLMRYWPALVCAALLAGGAAAYGIRHRRLAKSGGDNGEDGDKAA